MKLQPITFLLKLESCGSRGLLVYATGLLLTGNVFGQVEVPNAGFEQIDNSAATKTLKWKAEGSNFICITDNNRPYKGTYSLMISSKTEGNHFFNEEFLFKTQRLAKYKIKCAFRTKNLKGAVQLGARVFDSDGGTITKTVFTLTENGNQEWKTAEGEFISDNSSSKLRIFGNLSGTGDAWFDEISIEEIPAPTKKPTNEVMLYIHEYFDIIYENSIISNRNTIVNLKNNTMYLCADSADKNECYKVLKEYTTRQLKDGHSFFSTPEDWKEMMEGGKHPVTGEELHNFPNGKMLKENIAYISLPVFVSSDPDLMAQYADSLQNMIATFDKQNPKGWLVDLSNNGGGNCFPMIAGIGPLIGNGVCEFSFSGDGSVKKLIYDNGWTGRDTNLIFMKTNPYHLRNTNKPIAVIYGNETASSGEVTAITFIGLPNTKSFGQETAGATTRIDNFQLSDGAYLNLACGIDADRNKNKFGGKIKPDEETADTESAIAAAIKWILGTSK